MFAYVTVKKAWMLQYLYINKTLKKIQYLKKRNNHKSKDEILATYYQTNL